MYRGSKSSVPGRPWQYKAAAFTFAIGMAGTTLPAPLYGLYQEQIGFSSLMVTVIFATYAAGVIAVLTLASNFSDLLGRRPVLLAALGFSVASALCFVFEGACRCSSSAGCCPGCPRGCSPAPRRSP